MDELTHDSFTVRSPEEDLDKMEKYVRSTGANFSRQIHDTANNALVVALEKEGTRVGTIVIPDEVRHAGGYQQINHIYHKIQWTIRQDS